MTEYQAMTAPSVFPTTQPAPDALDGIKVMVTGSRKWGYVSIIKNALESIEKYYRPLDGMAPFRFILIDGGAKGADTIAAWAAAARGWERYGPMKPNYKAYPGNEKYAPLARNLDMLGLRPDVLLAFRIGGAQPHGGTNFTINEAAKRGIYTIIYDMPL